MMGPALSRQRRRARQAQIVSPRHARRPGKGAAARGSGLAAEEDANSTPPARGAGGLACRDGGTCAF